MNSKVYKSCAVPQCKNTTIKTPNKVFVYVPNKKIIRHKWLKLAGRNPNEVVTNSSLYFCEDHFDLPNDMENYMQYHVMGTVSRVLMKPKCMPHKFICQPERNKVSADTTERPYLTKKRRMMSPEECKMNFERKCTEQSSSEGIASHSCSGLKMDEDIDIEEHNLLENPKIKGIFPDITIIKEEIPEIPEVKSEPESVNADIAPYYISRDEGIDVSTEKDIAPYISSDEEIDVLTVNYVTPYISKNEEIDVFTEKDIAPYISRDEKINVSNENSNAPDVVFVDKRYPPTYGNKIILGSKPVLKYKVEIGEEKLTDKIYSSRVELVDISTLLEKSERFCKICRIYFSHKSLLQDHNKENHDCEMPLSLSLKKNTSNAQVIKYECKKCSTDYINKSGLRKHIETAHNRNQEQRHPCVHCKKSFPTQKSLIDHIYNVLTVKNADLSKTFIKDSIMKIKQRFKTRDNIQNFFRCLYCSKYFRDNATTLRHLRIKHSDESVTNMKPVSFDGRCKFCDSLFINWISYNQHVIMYHKEKINKTFKIDPKLIIPRVDVVWTPDGSNCEKNYELSKTSRKTNILNEVNERIAVAVKEDSVSTKEMQNDNYTADNYNPVVNYCNPTVEDYDNIANHFNPIEDIFVPTVKDNTVDYDNPSLDDCNSVVEDIDAVEVNNTTLTDNNSKNLVLKSVFFKCKRCDVNFLTSKSTVNHRDHMELLVNWKCSVCQQIFKQQDGAAHLKQHLNSDKFTVIDSDVLELDRLLYKCPKCATHFKEDNYFSHFESCGTFVAMSSHCKICDILIDRNLAGSHSRDHRLNNLIPADFTIIASDVIALNDSKCNTKDKQISNNSAHTKNIEINNHSKLFYCSSCKMFLNISVRKGAHSRLCGQLKLFVCPDCGLVFSKYGLSTHKEIHIRKRNLKLQNFAFYCLFNGHKIIPPVPEYPKCLKCEVHFIANWSITCHKCKDNDFLTCHVCNKRFSDSVFKLHVSFHYYSMKNVDNFSSIILSDENRKSKGKKTIQQKSGNEIDQHFLRDRITSPHKTRKDHTARHAIHAKDVLTNKIVPDNERSIEVTDKHVIQEINDKKAVVVLTKFDIRDTEYSKQSFEYTVDSVKKSDYELFNILYCCASCNARIDSYDNVIEHCQNHVCGVSIEMEHCNICKMTFERKSFTSHCTFHNGNLSKKPFHLLNFDIFYFLLSNEYWLEHLFKPINDKERQLILRRSIYSERKIKMKLTQEGMPELTVYKCSDCSNIVDPSSLATHAEISCFKMRKYPCSYCGLPFLSYLSRQNHENIHDTRKNITMKSYRIVCFNNEENDKFDNALLNKSNFFFYLYQCRNCNEVIDKYQRENHKCNKDNLRKCETCDLMFQISNYEAHCVKHQSVPNFVQRNMKVVLFGQKDLSTLAQNIEEEGLKCFDGTFVDYTFYRCVDCGVCFDKAQRLNHNVCLNNITKCKCGVCDLTIPKNRMIFHAKLHERNIEFVRENISVIPYTVSGLQVNFVPANDSRNLKKTATEMPVGNQNHNDNTKTKTQDAVGNYEITNMTERTAKLFKCLCGLHYLTNSNMQTHLQNCHPRIAKRRCTKCNLLFTPTVLFEHLLKHHGDQKYDYKFIIIKMKRKGIKKRKTATNIQMYKMSNIL